MEKIQLSYGQLSSLYKNNLILPSSTPQQNPQSAKPVNYSGGYQQKILWLHTEANHPYLSDEDHEMVSKILEACRLNWKDIALVNMIHSENAVEDIIAQLLPSCLIISLPEDNDDPYTQTELYYIRNIDKTKFVRTDILSDIRGNKDLKLKLWQGLKILFQL